MQPEDVKALAEGGESLAVEFKRATPRDALSDGDIVEAVVCLANGEGGTLLIGVEDDGTISGAAPRGPRGDHVTPQQLAAYILNKTIDPISTHVHLVHIDDVIVFVVEVPASPSPVCTSGGLYKRRTLQANGEPACVPFHPSLLVSTARVLAQRDYAEAPVLGLTDDDLDPAEFDRFRASVEANRGDFTLARSSNNDILRALRARTPDGDLTTGALLLFGREEAIVSNMRTAEVLLQIEAGGRLAVNTSTFPSLLKAAESLYERVSEENTYHEVTAGLLRVDIPRIPEHVVRESIANALIHRDYSQLGPIHVKLTDREFRLVSTGGLPAGVTLDNLLDSSRPRSPMLSDAFKRAGLVERTGRGVYRMYDALLRTGRGEPDYSLTNDAQVVITARLADSDIDMVRFVTKWEGQQQITLSLSQLRILGALRQLGAASSKGEIAETLNPPMRSVTEELAGLLNAGLIETTGAGRGRRYNLSSTFYRLGNDGAAYIHARGLDVTRQRHMVLEYVAQYGEIDRPRTANLCGVEPQQATRLLRELVDDGLLSRVGDRRWTKYVIADGGNQ